MLGIVKNIRREKHDGGFTLIELIIVIAVMGVISAVLVPSFLGITRRAKKRVCGINSLKIEEMYEVYLYEGEVEYSGVLFDEYVKEQWQGKDICPDHGVITYKDGRVKCGIHSVDKGKDDDQNNGDVPYI